MELWIKSQDREMLTKIDYVYLENSNGREILGGNHYMVNKFLGLYPTRERALEVLDEIQTKIATYDYQHKDMKCDYIKYESCIFEMPKE
ncbi:MAG: hypothetical protein IJI98_03370 [Methanosphaera sp.]|nr:hypothetical protein [Methanosphaera sp.]